VLASGRNVNILVLDTEVYSNTGGQASKSTPRGAVAKFAAGGKPVGQEGSGHDGHELRQRLRGEDRHGRERQHTVKAFLEAEAYDGPSLIIAYSHCIAHGYDMVHGMDQQKAAVNPVTGRCSAITRSWRPGQESPSSSIRARPASS
jgi:pyruvate-ferredoxin/flavodoxin oxidoreductase